MQTSLQSKLKILLIRSAQVLKEKFLTFMDQHRPLTLIILIKKKDAYQENGEHQIARIFPLRLELSDEQKTGRDANEFDPQKNQIPRLGHAQKISDDMRNIHSSKLKMKAASEIHPIVHET